MKIITQISILLIALALSACSDPEPPKAGPVAADKYQGRAETKSIQAADAIGYDGTAIQKKLDGALDANDRRMEELDKQIDEQPASEQSAEGQ